jgi:hypothetical protein
MFIYSNAQNVNFEWAKSIGGIGGQEGHSIALDANSNVYTTGSFQDTVDFDPGPNTYNLIGGITNVSSYIYISKLDANGNFLWAKGIQGVIESNSISVDIIGNVFITGQFSGTVDFNPGLGLYNLTASISDIYILKLDSAGNFLWAVNMGGNSGDKGLSISVDIMGNVYTTGWFRDTADFDPGLANYFIAATTAVNSYSDIFISKLDMNGSFVWAKSIGSIGTDQGFSINVRPNGYVYITGRLNDDIGISKLDSNGNFIWTKSIGGIGLDVGFSVAVDVSDNVYTTGVFLDTVDFNPNLPIYNMLGNHSIFILKLDHVGNFVWAKSIDGCDLNVGNSLVVDSSSNLYLVGNFSGTVDFDPGSSIYNITSNGGRDIFVMKLDFNANFIWSKSFGGINIDRGYSIAIDAVGNIFTTGYFFNTVDFDPGLLIFSINSLGNNDAFIHKMSQSTTGLNEEQLNNYRIFPNPTKDELNIQVEASVIGSTYQLTDITGRPIKTGIITDEKSRISLQGLTSGTYLLSIGDEIRKTLKVVKE